MEASSWGWLHLWMKLVRIRIRGKSGPMRLLLRMVGGPSCRPTASTLHTTIELPQAPLEDGWLDRTCKRGVLTVAPNPAVAAIPAHLLPAPQVDAGSRPIPGVGSQA